MDVQIKFLILVPIYTSNPNQSYLKRNVVRVIRKLSRSEEPSSTSDIVRVDTTRLVDEDPKNALVTRQQQLEQMYTSLRSVTHQQQQLEQMCASLRSGTEILSYGDGSKSVYMNITNRRKGQKIRIHVVIYTVYIKQKFRVRVRVRVRVVSTTIVTVRMRRGATIDIVHMRRGVRRSDPLQTTQNDTV